MVFNNIAGTNKTFIVNIYAVQLVTSISSGHTYTSSQVLPTAYPTANYRVIGNISLGVGSSVALRCENYTNTHFKYEVRNGGQSKISDVTVQFIAVGICSSSS